MQKKKVLDMQKAEATTLDRKTNRRDLEMTYDRMCEQRLKQLKI